MSTIIEAIYESGILNPLDTSGLQERHHYRLVLEEIPPSGPVLDSALAEIEQRRTKILTDDRRIAQLGGVLGVKSAVIQEGEDPVSDALEELRRERVLFGRV